MLHRRRAPLFAGLAAGLAAMSALFAGPVAAQTMPAAPPAVPSVQPSSASPAGPTAASASGAATPSSADAFAVTGVTVDISGGNPTTVRDQAIREAQAKAWGELYRRLVPGGTPPRLSENELGKLVQGFEIEEEKVSASRYLGSITVRFRPNAVRDALGQTGGAQYVEPPARPFVILPVTLTDGRTILWEDRTPWREAWEARPATSSLVPLVVPDGELADAQAMGAEDAVSGNADAIARMAQRYKAGGVVVARAELPAAGPVPARGLTVDVTRYGLDGTRDVQTVQVKGEGGADLLSRAVAAVGAQLDESWRREHTAAAGPEQTALVRVPLAGIGDWVEARKRLAAGNAVSRTALVSISRGEALVSLTYCGAPEQLVQALGRQDLGLVHGVPAPLPAAGYPGAPLAVPSAEWQLSLLPRGSGAAPAPGAIPAAPAGFGAPSAPLGSAPATGAPPRNLGTLPAGVQ